MKHLLSAIILLLLTVSLSNSARSACATDAGTHAESCNLPPPTCPTDMVEVEGDYCPNLQIECLYNVNGDDTRKSGPGDLMWSCGEYKYPTKCLSDKTVHMHFCMDKYEWPNKEGQVPQDWMSWFDVKRACESVGKRMCFSHEWTLAAEGPDRKPLPYGDGYHRDNTVCNFDRHYSDIQDRDEFKALGIKHIDVFQAKSPNDKMSQALRMFLVPSGSMPNCVSDYGVHDMAGNVDEFVVNEQGSFHGAPWISGLKGGHIWHVRNASRPQTDAHGPTFSWYETSGRCCQDIGK